MSLELINSLQQQIQTHMGSNYGRYLDNMRDWFGQRITKDLFDQEMSTILSRSSLDLHNEMMKLIIMQCAPSLPVPGTTIANINTASTSAVPLSTAFNNVVVEGYENSPGMMMDTSTILIGGPQQEPEYITINFVESEEMLPYQNVVQSPEEVVPDTPVDWLFNTEIVRPEEENIEDVSCYPSNERFPSTFASYFQILKNTDGGQEQDVIRNIPHGYDIADRLKKNIQLKKHFQSPLKENQPYLSTGASVYGRFLLKAWEHGMEGVDQQAADLILEAVKEHVRILVSAVVKQRRAFRMRDGKVYHSIGLPYPNPYLRQGQQLFDDGFCSDSTKMADVMQVPTLLPPMEEKERIASLQVSASAPPKKHCRFPASRATLTDLLDVINNDPTIIPKCDSRLKMAEIINQNYKGYGGSSLNEDDDDDDDESRELLPLCSY